MAHTNNVDVRPWQLRLMAGLALLAAMHSILVALWMAPTSPLRDVVGSSTLTTYVYPYFQQSWGQLPPVSQRRDEALRYRAHMRDPQGEEFFTPWVEITGPDTGVSKDPERAMLASRRLAADFNSSLLALSRAQRKEARTNYVVTPLSSLRKEMLTKANNAEDVDRYQVSEEIATRFISMLATATYDGTVLEVQFEVGRRSVPDFSERSQSSLEDEPFRWFTVGFRDAYEPFADEQSEFDQYVRG